MVSRSILFFHFSLVLLESFACSSFLYLLLFEDISNLFLECYFFVKSS